MKLNITVLPEDLRNGKPKAYSRCPIALAINRALGNLCQARVGSYFISTFYEGVTYTGITPSTVYDFINDFDHGYRPDLITFELELL